MAASLDRLINRLVILSEVERYAPPEPDPAAIREASRGDPGAISHPRRPQTRRCALRDSMKRRSPSGRATTCASRSIFANGSRAPPIRPRRISRATSGRHEADLRRTGRALDDPEVLRLARERVAAERQEAVVAEWVQGLRARAGVSTTPPLRD